MECSCCPLNADTHGGEEAKRAGGRAGGRAHAHLHTSAISTGSAGFKTFVFMEGFCIGCTTYSVSSNGGTWLSAFTLTRPWPVLECFLWAVFTAGRRYLSASP